MRHEQQWSRVLGLQDASLQAAAMQQQQQQHAGSAFAQATGALTALQRLGCQATAQTFVSGMQQQQLADSAMQHPGRMAWPAHGDSSLGGPQQLLQQQAQRQEQQQLLEAQHELTWRLSDWGVADSLLSHEAPPSFSASFRSTSLSSTASAVTASSRCKDTAAAGLEACAAGQGFNAAVLSALSALQDRDLDAFEASVSGARQQCVMHLARSSTESTAAVNPLLVQLQMLHMLAQGLRVVRAAAPAAGIAADAAPHDVAAARDVLQHLLGVDALPNGGSAAAEQLCSISFPLSDQLLALQAALAKVLRRPDALALTLQATASTARQAGQATFAAAALEQLQQLLQQTVVRARAAGAGLSGLPAAALVHVGSGAGPVALPSWLESMFAPDALWALEAVKLQWLQGQHHAAVQGIKALAAASKNLLQTEQAPPGGSGAAQLARFHAQKCRNGAALTQCLMLCGEWLAAGHVSSIGNSAATALAYLEAAAKVVPLHQQYLQEAQPHIQQQPPGEQHMAAPELLPQALHCRVFYQLATFADQQHQAIEAQAASPEGQKQQQVLQNKLQLLEQLNAAAKAARTWQTLPPAKQQAAYDAWRKVEKRRGETQRQVNVDLQVQEQMAASRRSHLATALAAYRDCISAGDGYDLQVVYRLCSLWFTNSGELAVNQAMQQVFLQVPRAKFVPLVYQIASRLDNSGSDFQVRTHFCLWPHDLGRAGHEHAHAR
jgi:ataxia telangiectasia mutated family protein